MDNEKSQNLQEALEWTRNFIKERLGSEHESIRTAAKQALKKLKQIADGHMNIRGFTPETLKDYVLGTDSSVYFTPRTKPTEIDNQIASLDREMKDIGLLAEDGKIRRYNWVEDIAPTRITAGRKILPYETKGVKEYIDDTHKNSGYNPMTNFRNRSSNNDDTRYYDFNVNGGDPSPFKKGNWTVRGEFKGIPDHYNSEFNTRYAKSIKEGEKQGRHYGSRNFTILYNDSNDPKRKGFYLFDQGMIPEGAVDGYNQDFFPYPNQTRLSENYTQQELSDINKEIQAKSQYGVVDTGESNHRRARLQKLDMDENGHLSQKAMDYINKLSVGNVNDGIDNNEGLVYDNISYIDPVTGGIRRKRRVFYSKGGRLPKAPTRDKYGNKIARADNLGTRDYDVYF